MKNPFVGKQGKGIIVGIGMAIASVIGTIFQYTILGSIGGMISLAALVSLFIWDWRPYEKAIL